MKRLIIILLLLPALWGNTYSQILQNTTKTVIDAADKKVSELIMKILEKKKTDTVAKTNPVINASPVVVSTWTCDACGYKGNTGNFCNECGTKKPEPIEPWTCPKCGKKENTGNFCTECGTKRPEKIKPWTCPKCGKKENNGKFCTECGTPKPEEWTCSVCGKANTGNFCDDCGEKKPEVRVVTDLKTDYTAFVETLKPESADKWMLKLSLYDDKTPTTTLDFLTFNDAVNGILELPTAKWMITADSSSVWRIRQQNVEAALSIMTEHYSNMVIGLNKVADSIKQNPAPVEIPKMAIDSADKAKALQEAGFAYNEQSEGRIEGSLIPYLSKKWEMEEADIKKILAVLKADENLAVKFVSEKYPDKLYTATTTKRPEENKEAQYVAISDTLQRINSEMESPYAVTLQEELVVAAEKIADGWMKSEECADVIELESTIDGMLKEWAKFDTKSKEAPSFWKDGRAAENSVIDSWNLKQAIEWRKIVEKHIELQKRYACKIAELESRIEQIRGGDDPTSEYLKAKIRCSSMISAIVKYVTTPAAVLCMPMAKHVDESQYKK